jgi:DNA-binding NarL/FixJ family response regulator
MNTEREKLNLLIIDDYHLIRDGLKSMLQTNASFEFIFDESESGKDALNKIKHKNYDLILMDFQLPDMNGKELTESILLYKPDMKILALSNFTEADYITSMIEAGAKGYILKNIEPYELIHAIKTTLNNKIYYSNSVALTLIENERASQKQKNGKHHNLTRREIEILRLIAQELTNDEIAKTLSIGKRTVDSHRQNLINKLNVKNSVGLIKIAYELKLI